MRRFILLLLVLNALVSCSEKEPQPLPPVVIPDVIDGEVIDLTVTPLNITTPDKGSLKVYMNNTIYKADFNAVDEPQSNATISFSNDTILTNSSREFTNLGIDAIAYQPVKENVITISFKDGRKVSGNFSSISSFGGVFGQQLIATWRDPVNPASPTQKAKDDIMNFVKRYRDKDGSGPGTAPVYLSVTVSK